MDSKNYPKSPTYKLFTSVTGTKSLFLVPKDEWISKRKAFAPGFSPKFLKDMVNTMIEKLQRFETCIDMDIDSGKATNMLLRSQTFTSDVIAAVAFGEDWGGDAESPHPVRVCKSTANSLYINVPLLCVLVCSWSVAC